MRLLALAHVLPNLILAWLFWLVHVHPLGYFDILRSDHEVCVARNLG